MYLSTTRSHEFVLLGQNKDMVTYNQLSPVQWMAGFCQTTREESDIKVREHMLDYVIDLLDDATEFSWSSAKASHAVLLCHMEQGEINSWLETDKCDRVCRAHAQRHSTSQGISQRTQDKYSTVKPTTCVYFNKGVCSQKQTHETKGVFISMYVRHVGRPKMATHSQTEYRDYHRLSKKKTISPGHDLGFESCP